MKEETYKYVNAFIKELQKTNPGYSPKDIFTWLVYAMANLSSIIGEPLPKRAQRRRTEGCEYVEKLGGIDVFQKLAQMVSDALEADREQDFLGTVYQHLSMNNGERGQIFTPYHAATLIARLTFGETEKEWTAVTDMCCGAGALLIAHSNVAKAQGKKPEEDFFYVANDIDRFCCAMTAVQMSMLGMAGVVTCSNALDTQAAEGSIFFPKVEHEDDIYYLSGCAYPVWQKRMAKEFVKAKVREIEEALIAEDEETTGTENVPPTAVQENDDNTFKVVPVRDCVQMTLFDLPNMKKEVAG